MLDSNEGYASGLIGSPNTILRRMQEFRQLGVECFHLTLHDELFNTEVLPALNSSRPSGPRQKGTALRVAALSFYLTHGQRNPSGRPFFLIPSSGNSAPARSVASAFFFSFSRTRCTYRTSPAPCAWAAQRPTHWTRSICLPTTPPVWSRWNAICTLTGAISSASPPKTWPTPNARPSRRPTPAIFSRLGRVAVWQKSLPPFCRAIGYIGGREAAQRPAPSRPALRRVDASLQRRRVWRPCPAAVGADRPSCPRQFYG